MFQFSLKLHLEIYFFQYGSYLKITFGMSAENACTSLCKVSVNLSDFDQTWNGMTHFNGTPKCHILSFISRCFPYLNHKMSDAECMMNNGLERICKKSGLTSRDASQALSKGTLWKHNNKFWEELITYYPLTRHGLHTKWIFQQLFYCCVCIRWRCNNFDSRCLATMGVTRAERDL
jgi:hypothetical protein